MRNRKASLSLGLEEERWTEEEETEAARWKRRRSSISSGREIWDGSGVWKAGAKK